MKKIFLLLKIFVSTIIIYYLMTTGLLDISSLSNIFLSPLNLLYSTILLLGVIYLGTIRWYVLLKSHNLNFSFRKILKYFYIGFFFNNILPGGFSGDLLRIMAVTKNNAGKRTVSASTILVDRTIGLVTILCFILFIILSGNDPIYSYLKTIFLKFCLYTGMTSIISLILLVTLYKTTKQQCTNKNTIIGKIFNKIIAIIQIAISYKNMKLAIITNIVISFIIQLLIGLTLLKLAKVINIHNITFMQVNLANLCAQLSSIIPISPGGVGVAEGTFAYIANTLTQIILPYSTIYLTYRILMIVISAPALLFLLTTKLPKISKSRFYINTSN